MRLENTKLDFTTYKGKVRRRGQSIIHLKVLGCVENYLHFQKNGKKITNSKKDPSNNSSILHYIQQKQKSPKGYLHSNWCGQPLAQNPIDASVKLRLKLMAQYPFSKNKGKRRELICNNIFRGRFFFRYYYYIFVGKHIDFSAPKNHSALCNR